MFSAIEVQGFAQGAVNHLIRLLGAKMIVDVDENTVLEYQKQRLGEKAAPKTINEEVGFRCVCWVSVANSFARI